MNRQAFRMGDWSVHPDLNQLSRDDRTETVEPKTMAVLVALAARAGQVVTTDELINEVWGGRPMGDNPVYKCVAKLRKVLDDASQTPRYIATVTKVGYRLIADTAPLDAGPGERVGRADADRPEPKRRWLSGAVAAGIVLGLAVAASLSWRGGSQPGSSELLLATLPGSHSNGSPAPNGRYLAFTNATDGQSHIWTLDLDAGVATQLTDGENVDDGARWAPNGDRILFMRDGGIWSVAASGGDPELIIQDGYNPDWAHDGDQFVFERRHEIWISNADGSNQRRVDGVPESDLLIEPRMPSMSPDGELIAFFHAVVGPMGDLWVVPAAGGAAKQLTSDLRMGGTPTWTPDGRHIIFSSQRGGSRTLWRVSRDGGEPVPVLTGAGEDTDPVISQNGKTLFYTNTRIRFVLTLTNPDTGETTDLLESPQAIVAPAVSPAADRIAYFATAPGGDTHIYTIPIEGGSPRAVTREQGTINAVPQWSGDGQRLYFYRQGPAMSFQQVAATGGPSEELVAGWNWNNENGARVDPSGSAIIYSRLSRGVPAATMLRDIPSGRETVFNAVLEWPRWSRAGDFLVGADYSRNHAPYRGDIVRCVVDTEECRILAEAAHVAVLSHDESEVYFVRPTRLGQTVFAVPADGSGQEREVAPLEPIYPPGTFYDVTPDGRIVWVRYEESLSKLWRMDLSN